MINKDQLKEDVIWINGDTYPNLIKQFSKLELKYNQSQPEISRLSGGIVTKLKEEYDIFRGILKRPSLATTFAGRGGKITY